MGTFFYFSSIDIEGPKTKLFICKVCIKGK